MISIERLEGIAKSVHDDTGIEAPVDPFLLAAACDFALKPGPRTILEYARRIIRYQPKQRSERQNFGIGHETSHGVLIDEGEHRLDVDIDEGEMVERDRDADYLSSALLLPQRRFLDDLGRKEWDLFEMKSLHPFVSHQAIAVRMCQVSPSAGVSVWDAGRLHRVYGRADAAADRELVDVVLELERPVRGDVSAWPIFDGRWRRVIVVRAA